MQMRNDFTKILDVTPDKIGSLCSEFAPDSIRKRFLYVCTYRCAMDVPGTK